MCNTHCISPKKLMFNIKKGSTVLDFFPILDIFFCKKNYILKEHNLLYC